MNKPKRPYRKRLKESARRMKAIRLDPKAWNGLDTLCASDGVSQGEVIETLILREMKLRLK